MRCIFCISYGALAGPRWMDFELYEQIARTLFPKALKVFSVPAANRSSTLELFTQGMTLSFSREAWSLGSFPRAQFLAAP